MDNLNKKSCHYKYFNLYILLYGVGGTFDDPTLFFG
jgi:hypothetical protein